MFDSPPSYTNTGKYRIDVSVYHWDNDRFERETKILRFHTIAEAKEAQSFLEILNIN